MAEVLLAGVHKSFGSFTALNDINLTIPDRALAVIVGPSGCGKSTLLRIIAGLETVTSGELQIAGRRVNMLSPSQRQIAMVFQSYALYPHMTVQENMVFGLKFAGVDKTRRAEKVTSAAAKLGLSDLLNRYPRQLSGGQRQRVAIGRAIVREPQVFLFDEPLSNLDASLRVDTRLEILKLHEQLGSTVVYVTHDQVEAMTLATQIVVLREGRIEQVGSPRELYHTPANRFVAGFIGSPAMNFLKSQVLSKEGGRLSVQLPGGSASLASDLGLDVGQTIEIGFRPEHVSVARSDHALTLQAAVDVVEWLGDSTLVYASLPGAGLVMRGDADARFARGDALQLGVGGNNVHLFAADGRRIGVAADA